MTQTADVLMSLESESAEERRGNVRRKSDSASSEIGRNSVKPRPTEPPRKTVSQLLRDKKRQAAKTMRWLEENYCACDDVCLPRGIVYEHYLDFSRKENIVPACKATFGKLIRNKFPHVTSKRLGARGHSKYHYNGIGVKHTSEYYHTVHTVRGLTRFSGCKMKNEGGFTRKYSLSSKVGTLLPDFPEASMLNIPQTLDKEMLQIFLTMYKTHCQCIVDTAISGNFEEIRVFLLHFWQGLPEHLLPLTKHALVVDVIAVCDWILYKTLLDILIPSTMQEMSESLMCGVRNLAHHWERWLSSSLENLTELVANAKLPVARMFARSLKRQISFLHLAQTIRPVLYDVTTVQAMTEDVEKLDIHCITSQTFYATSDSTGDSDSHHLDAEFLQDFKEQLTRQATVENFVEWLDLVVEQKIVKTSEGNASALKTKAQTFLLKWTYIFSRLSHTLTLNNAQSFASFHLLFALLHEYLLLSIEALLERQKEASLHEILQSHLKNSDGAAHQLYNAPTSCFLVSLQQQQQQRTPTKDSQDDKATVVSSIRDSSSYLRKPTLNSRSPKNVSRPVKNVAVVPPMEHLTNHPTPNNSFPSAALSCSHDNHQHLSGHRWHYAEREEYGIQHGAATDCSEPSLQTTCTSSCYDAGVQSYHSHAFFPNQDRNMPVTSLAYFSQQPHEGSVRHFQHGYSPYSNQQQLNFNGFGEKHCTTDFHAPFHANNVSCTKQSCEAMTTSYLQPVLPESRHLEHQCYPPPVENGLDGIPSVIMNRDNASFPGVTAVEHTHIQPLGDMQNYVREGYYPHHHLGYGYSAASDFSVISASFMS